MAKKQKYWLAFCVLATLATNSICWAKFEKVSLGKYKKKALSWMFCHSKIPWHLLFQVSVNVLICLYGITYGTLNIDETDNHRSKRTKKISWVHKLKDKATGGYAMGQCVVFIVLVTPIITIPVGFKFYMPDPDVTRWKKKYDKLKKMEFRRLNDRKNQLKTQTILQKTNWRFSFSKNLRKNILISR